MVAGLYPDFSKGGCRVGVLVSGMHVQMPPFMQRTKTVHKNSVKMLDKVE